MANELYGDLIDLSNPLAPSTRPEPVSERTLKLLAILASGKNPDGSNHVVNVGTAAADLVLFWTTGTLIAAASSETSPTFLDCINVSRIFVGRTTSGSVGYSFRIDWSRDGVAVDFTEQFTIADNTSIIIDKFPARYARMRVHNTDAVTAFTVHRTNVSYR